jgi:ABC-type antimicrobial peptide transport system permease subunit
MQPGYILLQVLIESVILLLLGLLAGNLLAWLSIVPIQDGIDLSAIGEGLELAGMSSILYPVVEFSDIARANLVVIVLGILASLLPALRAARHVPVDAITRP